MAAAGCISRFQSVRRDAPKGAVRSSTNARFLLIGQLQGIQCGMHGLDRLASVYWGSCTAGSGGKAFGGSGSASASASVGSRALARLIGSTSGVVFSFGLLLVIVRSVRAGRTSCAEAAGLVGPALTVAALSGPLGEAVE